MFPPVRSRRRAAAVISLLALVGAACSVEQGTAPPTSASTDTEPPATEPAVTEPDEPPTDTEPPTTDPSTSDQPPTTDDADEAFCAASGDFWLPTEALDYIDDANGAAAEQLFVDMGRLIDGPITTAPDEAAAAPALQMKSVLRDLIPLLDEIDFDINRAEEVSDLDALGEALDEFGSIADQLERFLADSCGFDPDELQNAASNYAAGVEAGTPSLPTSDPGEEPAGDGGAITSVRIEDASGTISLAVPAEWTDVNPSPSTEYLSVQASANLPAFLASFTEPGAPIEVYPSDDGAAAAARGLDAIRQSFANAGCADRDSFDYDDGVYVGTEVVLDCAEGFDLVLIGGTNDAADMFFIVAMLVPDDDPGIRDLIAESFIVD